METLITSLGGIAVAAIWIISILFAIYFIVVCIMVPFAILRIKKELQEFNRQAQVTNHYLSRIALHYDDPKDHIPYSNIENKDQLA